MIRQPYHLVEPSPWPLTASIGALLLTMGLVSWFHNKGMLCLYMGLSLMLTVMYMWWRDISREGTLAGNHTSTVVKNLQIGMLMLILSEVCFFFGFFWAFFHSSLVPAPELGCKWPPVGIEPVDTFSMPLANTVILLCSGATVTWAHHALLKGNRKGAILALTLTLILGASFSVLQIDEYKEASFSIYDGIYGSTFYVTTGFHGFHVFIGSVFLFLCLLRLLKDQFSQQHHFGFIAAAWYWHFVDVVWILLFISMYWWGGN
nr:cytochrome c oxidase subunit III [Ozobranchus jantseanus]